MAQNYEKHTKTYEDEALEPTPEQAEKIGKQAAKSAELSAETDEMIDAIDEALEETELLDYIEGILEANEQDFVNAFVQKGGQ